MKLYSEYEIIFIELWGNIAGQLQDRRSMGVVG